MPKPMFGDNGSGMHVHMSLWKDAKNLFFDANGYGLISDTARWYIGGVIKHAAAPPAFPAPTTHNHPRPGARPQGPHHPLYPPPHPPADLPLPPVSPAPPG